MSEHDRTAGGAGLLGLIRRRILHRPVADECDHPHVHTEEDGAGGGSTVLVCEVCGAPLDASDPALRRRAGLRESRVCVDCGGTYWTTGARRML